MIIVNQCQGTVHISCCTQNIVKK